MEIKNIYSSDQRLKDFYKVICSENTLAPLSSQIETICLSTVEQKKIIDPFRRWRVK